MSHIYESSGKEPLIKRIFNGIKKAITTIIQKIIKLLKTIKHHLNLIFSGRYRAIHKGLKKSNKPDVSSNFGDELNKTNEKFKDDLDKAFKKQRNEFLVIHKVMDPKYKFDIADFMEEEIGHIAYAIRVEMKYVIGDARKLKDDKDPDFTKFCKNIISRNAKADVINRNIIDKLNSTYIDRSTYYDRSYDEKDSVAQYIKDSCKGDHMDVKFKLDELPRLSKYIDRLQKINVTDDLEKVKDECKQFMTELDKIERYMKNDEDDSESHELKVSTVSIISKNFINFANLATLVSSTAANIIAYVTKQLIGIESELKSYQ